MTPVCNQYYLSPDIRQTLRSNQCCINGSPSGQSGKLFLQDNVQVTAIQQALGHCILMAIRLQASDTRISPLFVLKFRMSSVQALLGAHLRGSHFWFAFA